MRGNEEFFYLLFLVSLFLLSFPVEMAFFKFFKFGKDRVFRSLLLLFFGGLVLFLGWFFSLNVKEWASRELVRYTAIYLSSFFTVRAVYVLGGTTSRLRFVPYLSFTVAYVLSLFFVFPVAKGFGELYFKLILIFKKFFIYLGVLSLFFELSSVLRSGGIRRTVRYLSFLVITSVFLLWFFDYLQFDVFTLTSLLVVVLVTAVYAYFYSFAVQKVGELLQDRLLPSDVSVVVSNLKVLATLFYLLIVFRVLLSATGLGTVYRKLSELYLLKGDLVQISLANIVTVLVAGFLLFSLLNVVKKLVKLAFPPERRDVEGGSAEALVFNLGVLFNVIVLLSTLGITWKVLLPIAGTLGVGLGFGLQTIMNNYVSGFILLFSKKLKVGDIIELPSISVTTLGGTSPSVFGKIENIGILSTIVRTNDGVEISIPNSNFISSPIVNFSLRDPYVRLKIPVGVAYSSDPEKVREVLLSVVEELPYAVRFLPKVVRFEELGDSALIFRVLFWIDVRKNLWIRNVISDFYYKAWYKLKEAGIEIPFPQNDVWFRNSLKVEIEKPDKEEA